MTAKELVIGYEEPLQTADLCDRACEKIVLTGANGIENNTFKEYSRPDPSLGGDVGWRLSGNRYFEEMPKGNTNSCIQEIWEEFPSYTQYEVRSEASPNAVLPQSTLSLVRVLSGGEQAKVRL